MASSLSEARRRGFMDDLYRTEVPDEPQEVIAKKKKPRLRGSASRKVHNRVFGIPGGKPRLPRKTKVGPEVSDKPKIKRKKESLGYT